MTTSIYNEKAKSQLIARALFETRVTQAVEYITSQVFDQTEKDMAYGSLVLQQSWLPSDLQERIKISKLIVCDEYRSETQKDIIVASFSKDTLDICLSFTQDITCTFKKSTTISKICLQYLLCGRGNTALEVASSIPWDSERLLTTQMITRAIKNGFIFSQNGMSGKKILIPKEEA